MFPTPPHRRLSGDEFGGRVGGSSIEVTTVTPDAPAS
jgi:hypothetical protein